MALIGVASVAGFEEKKRNLLVASALGIVIKLAAPTSEIKVPGLGAEVSISSVWAYAFLFLAILYFFVQFYLSLQIVISSNSVAVERGQYYNIEEAIMASKESIKMKFQDINVVIETSLRIGFSYNMGDILSFNNAVLSEINDLKSNMKAELSDGAYLLSNSVLNVEQAKGIMVNKLSSFEDKFATSCKNLMEAEIASNEKKDAMHQAILILNQNVHDFWEACNREEAAQKRVESRLRTLSSNIDTVQKYGFKALDQWLPLIVGVIGMAFTVSGGCNSISARNDLLRNMPHAPLPASAPPATAWSI
jgi:hypothetical protein